ncbi:unnamed protein product [Cuscuta europaea]|uniref:Uncharacterized protein n=1 Tax=Cuscuta europaea TaxID=41803 RepID=A0A9P0YK47_CUSEU|nr:unnamed protein product [Cuscuta europaea]
MTAAGFEPWSLGPNFPPLNQLSYGFSSFPFKIVGKYLLLLNNHSETQEFWLDVSPINTFLVSNIEPILDFAASFKCPYELLWGFPYEKMLLQVFITNLSMQLNQPVANYVCKLYLQ